MNSELSKASKQKKDVYMSQQRYYVPCPDCRTRMAPTGERTTIYI
jgi:hypothetical protein